MDKGDLKGFYDKANELGMLYQSKNNNPTLRSKDGSKVLSTTQERKERWLEHHKDQLNITTNADEAFIHNVRQVPTNENLSQPITRGELRRALRKMRNGKAPGCDGIQTELLKSLDMKSFEVLFNIVAQAWGGMVPQEWKDAHIFNLKKKSTL